MELRRHPALTTIGPKLSKLIPLLGSDKDGEVVATARAITRTLKQAGLDLHDLVKALGHSTDPYDAIKPVRWRDLSEPEQAGWLDRMLGERLSPWERDFCLWIEAQFSKSRKPLSAKQIAILDRLIAKIIARARS